MHDSFWEADRLLRADACVIGAGIIGLSVAIELAQRHPSWRVVVLERGLVPTGASTRNAGFACIGSASEIWSDITLLGTDAALSIIEQRWKGLLALRARIGAREVGFEDHGGHEIFMDHHACLEHLDEINTLMRPIVGGTMFTADDQRITQYGFSPSVRTMLITPYEGTLHSGKLVDALWSIASDAGVRIHTGANVVHTERMAEGWQAEVATAVGTRTVRAGVMVECTNAVMETPARGQVMVTEPLASLPFRGSFHYDEGFYYFRSVGDRVLLGGGRNLAFDDERTASMDVTTTIQQALEHLLTTVIIPDRTVSIEYRWAGTMGFSATKHPRVAVTAAGYVQAFGCNGMGVAIGTTIAAQAANLVDAV